MIKNTLEALLFTIYTRRVKKPNPTLIRYKALRRIGDYVTIDNAHIHAHVQVP